MQMVAFLYLEHCMALMETDHEATARKPEQSNQNIYLSTRANCVQPVFRIMWDWDLEKLSGEHPVVEYLVNVP